MSQMHYHSLSLMLKEEDAGYINVASHELGLDFGEFIPHMTVLFSKGKLATPSNMKNITVEVQGLYLNSDAENRIWVGLTIKKTRALTDLYRQVAVTNDIAVEVDEFFPHVTLGCIGKSGLQAINMDVAAVYSKQYTFEGCSLALCKNGEYGKVVEVMG